MVPSRCRIIIKKKKHKAIVMLSYCGGAFCFFCFSPVLGFLLKFCILILSPNRTNKDFVNAPPPPQKMEEGTRESCWWAADLVNMSWNRTTKIYCVGASHPLWAGGGRLQIICLYGRAQIRATLWHLAIGETDFTMSSELEAILLYRVGAQNFPALPHGKPSPHLQTSLWMSASNDSEYAEIVDEVHVICFSNLSRPRGTTTGTFSRVQSDSTSTFQSSKEALFNWAPVVVPASRLRVSPIFSRKGVIAVGSLNDPHHIFCSNLRCFWAVLEWKTRGNQLN